MPCIRKRGVLDNTFTSYWSFLYTVPHYLQGTGQSNVYNNPELEMIAKDIQSLLSEKIQLEKESQNTDYNTSVKKTELHSLQSEYDTLASTFKQLTNQKDVAQKRLDDLDTQVCYMVLIISKSLGILNL